MASHGVPRATGTIEKSEETRRKDLEEIKEYQNLVETVNTEVAAKNHTPALLRQTAELLKRNPEYYTIWNHRRRIYASEFESLDAAVKAGSTSQADRDSQILDILNLDLQFLVPLLLKFPKCYWIWDHRLWLLQSATDLLPPATARRFWEEELGLVGKMLSRDSRNFHGWGYRRTVIASLESPELDLQERSEEDGQQKKGISLVKPELDYTTKMIKSNLSNFSAWHNRTKLILRMFKEQNATDEERKQMLDDELKLIHSTLFDPHDASLWAYHTNLLCTFDPLVSSTSMAPNLTQAECLAYLQNERTFVEEILEEEDEDDEEEENTDDDGLIDLAALDEVAANTTPNKDIATHPYKQLLEIALITARVRAGVNSSTAATTVTVASTASALNPQELKDVSKWLKKLYVLDPLRRGRWIDRAKSLGLLKGN